MFYRILSIDPFRIYRNVERVGQALCTSHYLSKEFHLSQLICQFIESEVC